MSLGPMELCCIFVAGVGLVASIALSIWRKRAREQDFPTGPRDTAPERPSDEEH